MWIYMLMFHNFWEATQKPVGDHCIFIHSGVVETAGLVIQGERGLGFDTCATLSFFSVWICGQLR